MYCKGNKVFLASGPGVENMDDPQKIKNIREGSRRKLHGGKK